MFKRGENASGGGWQETSLWTNPTPSASGGYAPQSVTLSDDITKYDYAKCKFKISGVSGEFATIMSVEDLQKATRFTTCPIFGLSGYTSGNAGFIRYMQYVSATSVKFTTSYQINGSATGNLAIIPLEVLGVKIS